MATYTHHPIDVPGNVIWFDETPVGVLAADKTTLSFANSSGVTATVLVGTGFTYSKPPKDKSLAEDKSIGEPAGGLVTSILRTSIDGTVVYETIQLSTPISLVALTDADTRADFFNLIMSGNDTLNGYAGNDSLLGGPGGDALNGGDGFDFADYLSAPEGVVVNLGSPAANTGHAAGDTYSSIEGILGSAFDDTLTGDANRNELQGGDGNDRLDGGPGRPEDVVNQLAADRMFGGAGDDIYVVDNLFDATVENLGEGTDTILAMIQYSLSQQSEVENITFTGVGNFQSFGNILDNIMIGGDGNDRLFGQDGDDTLVGGAGNDELRSDAGADRLLGGEGDDTLFIDTLDLVDGGPGFDSALILSNGADVTFDLGATSIERAQSFRGNDTLNATTQTQAVTIDAGDGNDRATGSAHDDTIIGGAGNDTIDGGDSSDTAMYSGNRADYTLVGTTLSFTIADGVADRDGADTVANMEFLEFADGIFAVADLLAPPPAPSDILLQNAAATDVLLWEVDGTSIIGSDFAGWTPGPDWLVQL